MDEKARALLYELADAIDTALDADTEHGSREIELTAENQQLTAQVTELTGQVRAADAQGIQLAKDNARLAKASAKELRDLRAAHAELVADMQKDIDALKDAPPASDLAVAYRVGSTGSCDVLVVWRGADTWAVTDGARAVWSSKDGWSTEDKLRKRSMTGTARFTRDAAFVHARSLINQEGPA